MIVIFMIQQIITKITTDNFCFGIFNFLIVPSNFMLKMSFEFFFECLQ